MTIAGFFAALPKRRDCLSNAEENIVVLTGSHPVNMKWNWARSDVHDEVEAIMVAPEIEVSRSLISKNKN